MDIKLIHRQAMEQSDLALLARMKGDEPAAMEHARSAYKLEEQAADSLLHDFGAEPTRSVLFRSAATLARDCGLFAEAEKLIYKGLAGQPPAEIVGELQDLLEQVSFRRHLELRGVELSEEEVQMAIAGKSVGFGMAPTNVVLSRVQSFEALLYRTAERKSMRSYRERGRRGTQLAQNEFYMSVPRAACFAVTFRVGGSPQQSLPGLSPAKEVIDELLDCLQLYTQGDEAQLKERIREDAYYRNFVGLARSLQPDGAKVNMVGFTAMRRGAPKQVAMRRASSEPPTLNPQDILPDQNATAQTDPQSVKLRGELLRADATKQSGEIEIVMPGNARAKFVVPPGLMSDIVKPLWESEVEVTGTRKGNKVHLEDIKAAS